MENLPKKSDVIIVGAGVSGLYAAWRLLKDDPKRKITILERLNRTGGRLDTDLIKIKKNSSDEPGKEQEVTVRDEEGGMRFTYQMKELMALFNGLDLCHEIVDFPMTTNRFFVRGHSFTATEATDDNNAIWGELYDLEPAEQNQSPGTILEVIYNRILKANGVNTAPEDPTPEFWQEFRKYKWDGIPLNEWQLGGLIRSMGYSQECLKMLVDTVGFQAPFLSTVNAGEAWQILEDFPKNPHYHTFKFGFSTLIKKLQKEIEKMAGQIIYTNINVSRIGKAGKDKYELEVHKTESNGANYPDVGEKKIIEGDKVILAIASNAMRQLFINSPFLTEGPRARQLWEDIHSVVNMRLLKINLYFTEPWWRNGETGQPIINFGPSFTDLPVNAVYPFYPVDGPSDDSPAALTIYCDYNNTNFWQGLQNVGPLFDSPLQRKHSQAPQVLFAASQTVVDEALKQFKLLFKTHYIPDPVMTSYRNWDGGDNFGYAYHQWALNADDPAVIDRMKQPIPGEHIYTCNEAWSDMQGWVNGSLRSTDLVLTSDDFGMEPITALYTSCVNPDEGKEG